MIKYPRSKNASLFYVLADSLQLCFCRYKQNAEAVASKFRDRLNTPIDTAVFWVEYVVRHKGAPELRSVGASLPWYQYYLVDVISLIIGTVAVILYSLYFVISRVVFLVIRRKKQKLKKS